MSTLRTTEVAKDKVRIQLLDSNDQVVKEVDVITSADSVLFADGTTFQDKLDSGVLKGEQGEQGIQGIQGVQGIQGIAGKDFSIKKTYTSVAEMNGDFGGVDTVEGDFVLIATGNVEDEDNAKLYVKTAVDFKFLIDMSGSQGIKGDKGDQGIQGIQGEQGIQGIQGEQGIQGNQGEPGDTIRVGETFETSVESQIFFKVIPKVTR